MIKIEIKIKETGEHTAISIEQTGSATEWEDHVRLMFDDVHQIVSAFMSSNGELKTVKLDGIEMKDSPLIKEIKEKWFGKEDTDESS